MPAQKQTMSRHKASSFALVVLALVVSFVACGGDGGVAPSSGNGQGGANGGPSQGGGATAAAGQTVFWTRNAQLLPLTIYLNRVETGAITGRSDAAPACGSAGAATLSAPESGSSLVEAYNAISGNWLMSLPSHSGCTAVEIVYVPAILTIAASGSGSGIIQSASRVIDCTITAGRVSATGCVNTRNAGSAYNLRATAASGSQFIGWQGGCPGVGNAQDCSYVLGASATLTAQFEPTTVASATGRLSIWTDYASAINVQVNGAATGSLTQYFATSTPTCGQVGTLTVTLPVGTHAVSGVSGSTTWNTSGSVTSGGCTLLKLSAPAGGGGTGGTTTGRLSIWTDYASAITVHVDGAAAGSLTQYFPSSTPSCGQAGTLTVTLPAGTHAVTGVSGSTTWNTSGSVTSGGCTLLKLSAPGGGGGGGSSSSSTGVRVALCVSNLQAFANATWIALPSPISGLDAKVWYSTTWSTADVVFRNRYQTAIHFNEVVYRSGINPPPRTVGRHDLSAGRVESPPGPTTGVNVGLGGSACVVVDAVRFGADSGPYYNP